MKTIDLKLSASGIRQAINELRQYKSDVERKVTELIRELITEGESHVAAYIATNISATGELLRGINSTLVNDRLGLVEVNGEYAVYVEFGAGVVGSAHPHPDVAILGWQYDINGHGVLGWWYPSEATDLNPTNHKTKSGNWVAWTKGMPSRPFMYDSAQRLRSEVIPVARRVFNS